MSMRIKVMTCAALGLFLLISACSALQNFKRIGTYEYEGEEFDVYLADDVEHSDDVVNASYYTLVPKGENPSQLTVVAQCEYYVGSNVSECEKIFGRQLRQRGTTKEDDGGMGY